MNQRPTAYEAVALPLSYRGCPVPACAGLLSDCAPGAKRLGRLCGYDRRIAGIDRGQHQRRRAGCRINADRALRLHRSPPGERIETAAGRAQRLPLRSRRAAAGADIARIRRRADRAIEPFARRLRLSAPRFPRAAPSADKGGENGRPATPAPRASGAGAPRPTAAPRVPLRRARGGFRRHRDYAPRAAAARPRRPAARWRAALPGRAWRVPGAAPSSRRARWRVRRRAGAHARAAGGRCWRQQAQGRARAAVAWAARPAGAPRSPARSADRLSSYSTTPRP